MESRNLSVVTLSILRVAISDEISEAEYHINAHMDSNHCNAYEVSSRGGRTPTYQHVLGGWGIF